MKRIIFNELKRPFALMTVATMIFGGYLETSEGMDANKVSMLANVGQDQVKRFFPTEKLRNFKNAINNAKDCAVAFILNFGSTNVMPNEVLNALPNKVLNAMQNVINNQEIVRDLINQGRRKKWPASKIANSIITNEEFKNIMQSAIGYVVASIAKRAIHEKVEITDEDKAKAILAGQTKMKTIFSDHIKDDISDNIVGYMRNEEGIVDNIVKTAIKGALKKATEEIYGIFEKKAPTRFEEEVGEIVSNLSTKTFSGPNELLVFVNDLYEMVDSSELVQTQYTEKLWEALCKLCGIDKGITVLHYSNNNPQAEDVGLMNICKECMGTKSSFMQFIVSTYITYRPELGAGDPLRTLTILLASPDTFVGEYNGNGLTKERLLNNLDSNVSAYIKKFRYEYLTHISKHWKFVGETFKLEPYCKDSKKRTCGFTTVNRNLGTKLNFKRKLKNLGKNKECVTVPKNNRPMKHRTNNVVDIIVSDYWKEDPSEESLKKLAAAEVALNQLLFLAESDDFEITVKNNTELQILPNKNDVVPNKEGIRRNILIKQKCDEIRRMDELISKEELQIRSSRNKYLDLVEDKINRTHAYANTVKVISDINQKRIKDIDDQIMQWRTFFESKRNLQQLLRDRNELVAGRKSLLDVDTTRWNPIINKNNKCLTIELPEGINPVADDWRLTNNNLTLDTSNLTEGDYQVTTTDGVFLGSAKVRLHNMQSIDHVFLGATLTNNFGIEKNKTDHIGSCYTKTN